MPVKEKKLTRSAKITIEILDGQDILQTGHETAQRLWNYTRYCLIGYNEKLRRERGDDWERFKRNQAYNRTGEKYPGNFTLQKELKDYWAAKNLSDRCFSTTIKEFDIAMRSWFSNLKSNPQARPPRYAEEPRQLTFEVGGRNAKPVGEWTYRLTVLGGHIPERRAVVKLRLKPGIKMAQVKLIRIRPDRTGTIVYYEPQKCRAGEGVAGIDLGIINIAAVAFQNGQSILYSGKAILASDQWYQKRAAKCKPKNWAKGKRQAGQSKRNRQYRQKAGHIRRLAVHNLTRNIIDECVKRGVGVIVIGDLKGIRAEADHGKRGNQRLHAWPFDEIKRQIEYKAEEVSIEVISVSERNTSKCCHFCLKVGVRNPRGLLKCYQCGIAINSDVNGAFNILNKVSPSPAYAGVGVGAILPGPPSPVLGDEISFRSPGVQRTGQAESLSQIQPTFVAKFDLRNWAIVQTCCNDL